MVKLGKLAPVYDSRDILYANIRPRTLTVTPPAVYGRGMDFKTGAPPAGWGMGANGPEDDRSLPDSWVAAKQGAGDCTIADPAKCERMNALDAQATPVEVSGKTCIVQYSDLTLRTQGAAYDPVTGANDSGLLIRDVLKYRQNPGFLDDAGRRHVIGTYVALEVGNWQHLREAVWLFPGVSIGITVTQSMEDQFSAGKMWSVVPGMMNNQLGGHDVPLVGHGPGTYTSLTWAQRQVMTYALLLAVCDEAWAYIDPGRYEAATGKTYNGYSNADLEAYIAGVAAAGGVHNLRPALPFV